MPHAHHPGGFRKAAQPVLRAVLPGVAMLLFVPCVLARAAGETAGAARPPVVIPEYLPFHIAFTTAGFLLLVAAALVSRYRLTGRWHRNHTILAVAGVILLACGLLIGVLMISLSRLPHLRSLHDWLSAGIGIVLVLTVGYPVVKKAALPGHRRAGRLLLVLVAIEILLGILMILQSR